MIGSPVISRTHEYLGASESRSFLDAWPLLQSEPIFVMLGVQGSGTNLLSRILERVFGISITRDRSLICSAALRIQQSQSPQTVTRAMHTVYQSIFPGALRRRLLPRAYYRQAGNYKGVEEAIRKVDIESAADFANFWYSYHAFTNKCNKKGVKSDDVWRHAAHFDTLFPNRRMVRLLRDPRDNALSITGKDWGPCNVLCAADFVIHQATCYDEAVADRADLAMVTKYEELLTAPADFVKQFAERFSILPLNGWEDRLLQIGIRSANRQKWRTLPLATLEHLEHRLGHLLEAHAYKRETRRESPPSSLQTAAWRFDDIVRRIPQKLGKVWRRRVVAR